MQIYSDVVVGELPAFLQDILRANLEKEGEWSNDKHDHPTKWGIIQGTADEAGWTLPLVDITYQEALQIWALLWWYKPRYDLIAAHSLRIVEALIDTSGPAGRAQGIKHFQQMLNDLNDPTDEGNRYGPDLKVDGLLGGKSMARLGQFLAHRGQEGEVVFAAVQNAFQATHFSLTARKNEGKRDFIYGWWRERYYKDMVKLVEERHEPTQTGAYIAT